MADHPVRPPDRGALWTHLRLSGAQLAALCGVTPRQVTHWTARGYLTPAPRCPARYNGDAIDMCVLIKQGRARGLPLHRASACARAFLAAELTRQPATVTVAPTTLAALVTLLRQARAQTAATLALVESGLPEPEGPASRG